MTPATMMRLATLGRRLRNRLFNAFTSTLCGQPVNVDWSDLKVIHPERISIGRGFAAGRGLWLESVGGRGSIVIGENVNVSDHVHIGAAETVQIGDGTLIGSKVLITDHSHGVLGPGLTSQVHISPNRRPIVSKGPVRIGPNVWIGDNVCILGGVVVGAGAVIGANAVVNRDVPVGTVWAGIPASQVWPRVELTIPIDQPKR